MTHVSLFTGIGGLDLAAEWAGFETVLQVEREPFALEVLEKHWPDVPRITDVREVHSDDRWTEPTVVSGGFPCQPFSAAGKRRGSDDDRYLWPELLRIVDELRPSWVIGENVSGLLSIREGMEIDDMLASLEAANYSPWILHYPAAGVGAQHKRDRVFIVGHAVRNGFDKQHAAQGRDKGGEVNNNLKQRENRHCTIAGVGADVADTERSGRDGRSGELRARRRGEPENGGDVADSESRKSGEQAKREGRQDSRRGSEESVGMHWKSEPDVGRVASRIPRRVDRLKSLGNAVVPQQAYPIFKAIAEAMEWNEQAT